MNLGLSVIKEGMSIVREQQSLGQLKRRRVVFNLVMLGCIALNCMVALMFGPPRLAARCIYFVPVAFFVGGMLMGSVSPCTIIPGYVGYTFEAIEMCEPEDLPHLISFMENDLMNCPVRLKEFCYCCVLRLIENDRAQVLGAGASRDAKWQFAAFSAMHFAFRAANGSSGPYAEQIIKRVLHLASQNPSDPVWMTYFPRTRTWIVRSQKQQELKEEIINFASRIQAAQR